MSPEQARGEEVDHRTDIWSFGVVLYEMLCGQLPFKGDKAQAVIYSILNQTPESITRVRSEIPSPLEEMVFKALEKNPDDRYQHMDELLDDLKSQSAGIVPEEIKFRLRKAKLRKRKRAVLFAGSAGVLIIAIILALSLFTGRAEALDAIAVLPIENLTGDPEQEYFADAATDELIGQLAQIEALRVISRRSVIQYKGVDKSLPEIAKELKVDAVVEGSVLQVGENVRVRLRLIDALPEERNLWGQTYDRDMADVLVMYNEMARAIADKTRVELTPEEEAALSQSKQVNPEAYEAYTRGMFHFYQLTAQDLEKAMGYFELALEKDPNYALAYLGIAHVWGGYQIQGLRPSSETMPKAKEARLKALELDDTLEEIHYTFAVQRTWYEWDWENAEQAYKRAIELNPNYPDPRAYYSQFLFFMGRPEEAMAQIERALELDPLSATWRSLYAWDLMYAGRFKEAVENLEETLRTAPQNQLALSALKSAYHVTNRYEDAIAVWRTWFASKDDQEAEETLTRGYDEADYSGALSAVAEMMIERSKTTYVTPWQIATLYTRAGKREEAIDWLEKAFDAHDANMPYISVDPIFDDLRDNPRFQELIRKMNLPIGD
jgi:TolB-like protein/Tfp pilus assembly protein PilF